MTQRIHRQTPALVRLTLLFIGALALSRCAEPAYAQETVRVSTITTAGTVSDGWDHAAAPQCLSGFVHDSTAVLQAHAPGTRCTDRIGVAVPIGRVECILAACRQRWLGVIDHAGALFEFMVVWPRARPTPPDPATRPAPPPQA